MCTPKAPKGNEKDKPVQYLRNPYLDGLSISGASQGRASLRIDPASPAQPARIAPPKSGLAIPTTY